MYAIHWCELYRWLSTAAHVTRRLHTASVRWHQGSLLSSVALSSRFYSHRIQTWAIKAASYLARWILRSHMQYAIKNSSNSKFQVSQGSVEIYLRWAGQSLWRVQNFLRNLTVRSHRECRSCIHCHLYSVYTATFVVAVNTCKGPVDDWRVSALTRRLKGDSAYAT